MAKPIRGSFLLELGVPAPLSGAAMPVESPLPVASPVGTRVQKTFQAECVELFAEVVQSFGVPKSVGQIYGFLYASPQPLSFFDIVARLEISKGSASQGLQLLRTLGAINVANPRLKASGDKPAIAMSAPHRDYYEPELSLRRLMNGILRERVAPLAATSADRLAQLSELAESNGEGGEFYLDRVRQLEIWRRRLKTVLPVLVALLGPKNKP